MSRRTSPSKRTLKKTRDRVRRFLQETGGLVFFFDEGRFGLKPVVARHWARRGQRSRVRIKPGYKSFYSYSAVSPVDGDSFTLFLPEVSTVAMKVYLGEMARAYPSTEIMLIMDRAGWHMSKDLELPKNIQIVHLPAYSPELNPVEKLWQWIRRHACRNQIYRSLGHLEEALVQCFSGFTRSFMRSLCACTYL